MFSGDARRYRRILVDLPARVVVNGIDEIEGRLLNMSPGNLALQVDYGATTGDAAQVFVKDLDVIEGTVSRVFPDGFALSFILPKKRRALLTEQLILRANPNFASGLADRRSGLRRQESTRMVCRLSDGSSLFVKIVDMSVDGVAIDSPRRPPIGTAIQVGRSMGTVARHTPRGFVVVYDNGTGNANTEDLGQEIARRAEG